MHDTITATIHHSQNGRNMEPSQIGSVHMGRSYLSCREDILTSLQVRYRLVMQ